MGSNPAGRASYTKQLMQGRVNWHLCARDRGEPVDTREDDYPDNIETAFNEGAKCSAVSAAIDTTASTSRDLE